MSPGVSADEQRMEDIVAAMRTVMDPEIPVNIYDLGLIYKVSVNELNIASIEMTLTAPGCPVAGEMVGWVQKAVNDVTGVDAVMVKLVFDPPWDQSKMSEEVKLELGFM
ncbi:iron-sulfur cluster assembly protein [Roseibium aggregatum]|uniref:iron-sulfur cluster assembly protein n=1 Tax=Roseibium aggregatum TaxID=187304 RepID=UPI003A97C76A